ncbi:MAG: HlyC/CorC family transporter [Saprospiraceae bacterium]|jgi:putative hemolysin|nr:HlyC/CorC family transporter [Saprospiraceae bacterium]MBP9209013.1 HlyC/CorC family transporter [Saprospiraceae bacterium]MBV6472750.1 hypothetical protein [Saprospiraceae bacterium]
MDGVVILFFLLLSALFSGAEIAFISANKFAVEVRKNRGSGSGLILSSFYRNPNQFIATMLVGTNIANVVLTLLLTRFFEGSLMIFPLGAGLMIFLNTFLVSVVILIFGEFVPKIFFRLYANRVLQIFAYPLLILHKLLYIPSRVLTNLSAWIIRTFLRQPTANLSADFSSVDLEHYLEGPINIDGNEVDANIFKNALTLKQTRVIECMVPRTEMVYVDVADPIGEVVRVFSESKLSRIIVVDGDIDEVLGYIHHQQMFKHPQDVRSIMMELPFVPETMNIYDLMLRMNLQHLSVACVVDEFGGTSGIITMEDILEEIFGEIEDEHDKEEFIEQEIAEGEFIFSGRLELNYLEEKYGISLPEGEYHTLSGYLVTSLGTIPEQGVAIEQDGFRFVPELVSDTKIETIRVVLI